MLKERAIRVLPLEEEERAFLKRKLQRDNKIYRIVYGCLWLLMLAIAFANGWYSIEQNDGKVRWFFSLRKMMNNLWVLLLLGHLLSWVVYTIVSWRLRKDIRKGVKYSEPALITQKKFMPTSNTYYFYLDSPNKYSIEVSEDYFRQYEVNDEVMIEYTPYAKVYFEYY